MATIMTKRGQLDNVVTYEHICDTVADMANINPSYVTLGSVCIVIKGENDDLEVYMADSKKEWKIISSSSGESGSISSSGIHICAQDEYDSVTGMPTIKDPLSNTFYLTPGGSETNDLYNEWIWLEDDEEWEKFGSATTTISQPDWNQPDPYADDYIKNKPAIRQQVNGGGILENGAVNASGLYSHAEGSGTNSTGRCSHAEGDNTTAFGVYSHAEGGGTNASSAGSHAEGGGTTASGTYSHAEGGGTTASGYASHAEGSGTQATAETAHAEGSGAKASALSAHAEGSSTTASGQGSHAEGGGTTASGSASHAEGGSTTASGPLAHAEGGGTVASGYYSHAEGSNTTANHLAQHVFGMHNVPDSSTESTVERGNYVEIVGNGLDANRRSNARTLDWEGNEEVAGDVKANACGGANPISLTAVSNSVQNKLDKNQGAAYSGKFMGINNSGNIVPLDVEGGNIAVIEELISGEDYELSIREGETSGVVSVAGKTGTVTLNSNDIAFNDAVTYDNGTIGKKVSNLEDIVLTQNNEPTIDENRIWIPTTGSAEVEVPDINEFNDLKSQKVDKSAIDNAGIINKTYDIQFDGEFTVTTEATEDFISPYAVAVPTGYLDVNYLYRITLNGVQYILPVKCGFDQIGEQTTHNHNIKMYNYVGNIGLYINDTSAIIEDIDDVPFIIINYRISKESLEILTDVSGTYTILVEKIIPDQRQIPVSLLYGSSKYPIHIVNDANNPAISIGINEISKVATGSYAIGTANAVKNNYSFAIGSMNLVTGTLSAAIGRDNTVSSDYAIAIGNETTASGYSSFSCGEGTTASNKGAHSEGSSTTASGAYSHAEGNHTLATLDAAHAEGINTIANGPYSHAEGNSSSTSQGAVGAHAEGYSQANASYAHAEGQQNVASGQYSHVEGRQNNASGDGSHVEGRNNSATRSFAHAEGNDTIASGAVSHAEGKGTIATCRSQHVSGEYNVVDPSSATFAQLGIYAQIAGNGTDVNNRSNAYALDWTGNGYFAGDVYVGCNNDSTGGVKLARIPDPPNTDGTYILQASVSSGEITYSWVVQS